MSQGFLDQILDIIQDNCKPCIKEVHQSGRTHA